MEWVTNMKLVKFTGGVVYESKQVMWFYDRQLYQVY